MVHFTDVGNCQMPWRCVVTEQCSCTKQDTAIFNLNNPPDSEWLFPVRVAAAPRQGPSPAAGPPAAGPHPLPSLHPAPENGV